MERVEAGCELGEICFVGPKYEYVFNITFEKSGFVICALRNRLMMTDMNMLVTVGEKAAPIAVPLVC